MLILGIHLGREPGQEETYFRTCAGGTGSPRPERTTAMAEEEKGPPPARPLANVLRTIFDVVSDMDIS